MKIWRDESGQMLVLTAISLTLLMGFMALAVDVGTLFRAKREVQTAADAAAIAAALQTYYVGSGALTAAQTAATNNGIPNASSNVSIYTGSNITSPYHNGSGYVQAVVTMPNPTYFLSAFKALSTSLNVTASAIAGSTPGTACIYVLDPTDASSLYIQGNAHITAPNCGIQVNSNSPDAFCDQGSATINASFLHIVGGQSSKGKCGKPSGTATVKQVAPLGDPFNNMTGPIPSTDCNGANTVSAATVNSGTAIPSTTKTSGGTSASVTCFSSPNVTIGSGVTLGTAGGNQIFVFENGVKIGGTVTVNGTIDVYQGTFSQGNSALTVNAPADKTATYNGIAVMEPSSDTTSGTCKDGLGLPCLQLQFGSGYGNLNGIVYAPTSQVYQQDHGGQVDVAGVIAYQIYLKASDMVLSNNYNTANPTTTPLSTVALVE